MSFSIEIRKIRQNALMSQQDFAKELGVSFSTVNRWETGKTLPTYKAMKAIDEYCKKNDISFDIKTLLEDKENEHD